MIYTIDRFVPSENDEHEPYPLLTKPVLDLLYATDERITQVACGSDYYLSLTSSGFVYSWGLGNKYSQLGRKILSENKKTEMKRLHRLDLESIIQISAGRYHSACLDKNGKVFVFGHSAFGKTGFNDGKNKHTPEILRALEHRTVIHISAGDAHTCCLDDKGVVWIFGWGTSATTKELDEWNYIVGHNLHLGLTEEEVKLRTSAITLQDEVLEQYKSFGPKANNTKYYPRPVFQLMTEPVAKVECRGPMTVVLTKDGRVFTFGTTSNKLLGRTNNPNLRVIPQPLELAEKIVDIAVGTAHTILLSESGVAYTYGHAEYNALARPFEYDKTDAIPLPTSNFGNKQERIASINACGNNSVFITESGRAYVTGSLQDGCGKKEKHAMRIFKGRKVLSVSIGYDSLIAVLDDSRTDLYSLIIDETLHQHFADFKIVCQNCEITVNRSIIIARCEWITSMMKAGENSVYLSVNVSRAALDSFVKYIYTDQIDSTSNQNTINDILRLAVLSKDSQLRAMVETMKEGIELAQSSVLYRPNQSLASDMASLLQKGQNSDVTFKVYASCDDTTVQVKAHKCILSARSAYFRAMLAGCMKEGETRVIDLTQNEASQIKYEPFMCALEYLYTGGISERLTAELACEVLILANLFSLPVFQEICEEIINEQLIHRREQLHEVQFTEIERFNDEKVNLEQDLTNLIEIAELYDLGNVRKVCELLMSELKSLEHVSAVEHE